MGLEMTGKLDYPFGKHGYLNIGRARIFLIDSIGFHYGLLLFLIQCLTPE
jgi:hypothetical protein